MARLDANARAVASRAEDSGSRGRYQIRNFQGRFVEGGSGIEWVGLDLVDEAYVNYANKLQDYRMQLCEELAPVIEEYMRLNAPWQDRTGKARAGLKAIAVHGATSSTIWMGYDPSTPYGFFLENYTYNGVSYAIVRPTAEYFAPIFEGMVREAV